MYICIHIYVYVYMYKYIHSHMYTYMCTYIRFIRIFMQAQPIQSLVSFSKVYQNLKPQVRMSPWPFSLVFFRVVSPHFHLSLLCTLSTIGRSSLSSCSCRHICLCCWLVVQPGGRQQFFCVLRIHWTRLGTLRRLPKLSLAAGFLKSYSVRDRKVYYKRDRKVYYKTTTNGGKRWLW